MPRCLLWALGVASAAAATTTHGQKRVMVWTTDDAANTNATLLAEFMQKLASVKDVVDVVSPCSYYIQQIPPHNLIRKDGANKMHQALKAAGFGVVPLVGDIGGGWNMSWYRDTFHSGAFADAAVKEIKNGALDGLNFDYEPHQLGNNNDAAAYMAMVQSIINRSKATISVDFPCNGLCNETLFAQQLQGGKFMDMGTYAELDKQWGSELESCAVCPKPAHPYPYGNPQAGSWCCSEPLNEHHCTSGKICCLTPGSDKTSPYGNDGCEGIHRCGTNPTNQTACRDVLGSWTTYMKQNIALFGLERYGLGVCPSCSKGLTAVDIAGRFAAAEAAGVLEVDFWSGVNAQDAVWWSAIRKWKLGGGGSWASWAAKVEAEAMVASHVDV